MNEELKTMQTAAESKIQDFSRQIREHIEEYGENPCDYLLHRREMLRYHQGEYNAITKLRAKFD